MNVTTHILKTLPNYWDAVKSGDKTFEVRKDDRGFQKGDILILRRLVRVGNYYEEHRDNDEGKPTYHELTRRISYILTGGQFGIEPGCVVLGLHDETEKQ